MLSPTQHHQIRPYSQRFRRQAPHADRLGSRMQPFAYARLWPVKYDQPTTGLEKSHQISPSRNSNRHIRRSALSCCHNNPNRVAASTCGVLGIPRRYSVLIRLLLLRQSIVSRYFVKPDSSNLARSPAAAAGQTSTVTLSAAKHT